MLANSAIAKSHYTDIGYVGEVGEVGNNKKPKNANQKANINIVIVICTPIYPYSLYIEILQTGGKLMRTFRSRFIKSGDENSFHLRVDHFLQELSFQGYDLVDIKFSTSRGRRRDHYGSWYSETVYSALIIFRAETSIGG